MGIEVKDLSFSYGQRKVLEQISFSVEGGEFLSILGANGVGKSTLFRCMLGLLKGYDGQVLIDGNDSRKLPERELAKRIAYIPQSSSPAFHFSVFDIVLMGLTSSMRVFGTPGKEEKERVMWALDKIGITSLADRCFHRLSGGERQLVMIARALVQNAPILMLDEPTASLDFGNQLRVLRQMRNLADEGYTIVQTTHDPDLCYMFSDRILALKAGKILAEGTPQKVMTEDVINRLYGVDVQIIRLLEDRCRVCLPKEMMEGGNRI